jgi:hypothetical protein
VSDEGEKGEKGGIKQRREDAIAYWLANLHLNTHHVARLFDIPTSTLYHEIRKRGLKREGAIREKRERVAAHFAGALPDRQTSPEYTSIQRQVDSDISDMESCLGVARRVVRKYAQILEDEDAALADPDMDPIEKAKLRLPPKELKVIAEGNNVAMETIRKIRGLDAPLDWSQLSDEQVERLSKGLPL